MKRTIFFLLIFSYFYVTRCQSVLAWTSDSDSSATPPATQVVKDERISKLKQYLSKHNSPLTEYASVFVEKADYYGLPDWKLVPAITGVESTFGKRIPFDSYNAYGWANGAYSFQSWEQSIEHVTKTLKEKYYDRGRTSVETIARVYAPPSTTWARNVTFFMNQIDSFVPQTPESLEFTL